MPTQVQPRRAVDGTQSTRTLTSGELDYNTTKKRLHIHDGVTAGGTPHANYVDVQNNVFTYATASGVNSLTVTYSPAPTAYTAGQSFQFKAGSTNTGIVTLNVNGLGAKNVYKIDPKGGAVVALEAGDIVQNGIYTAFYDGTQFQINVGGSVSQYTLIEEGTFSNASTVEFASLPNNVVIILNAEADVGNSSAGYRLQISDLTGASPTYLSTTTPDFTIGYTTSNNTRDSAQIKIEGYGLKDQSFFKRPYLSIDGCVFNGGVASPGHEFIDGKVYYPKTSGAIVENDFTPIRAVKFYRYSGSTTITGSYQIYEIG